MLLKGQLAKLMVITLPLIYQKCVTVNTKGKKILCMKMKKAFYGMLKSDVLFYRKLFCDLKRVGFTINPYDPCVAKKEIKGKQMTIIWHVNDLKISHVDANEVGKMIKYLKSIHGQKITEKRGKVHDFLK